MFRSIYAFMLIALLFPLTGWSKNCGHASQWSHAFSCLRAHANETIKEGERPHLIYVRGNQLAKEAMQMMLKDYQGRDLTQAQIVKLLDKTEQSEWFGVAFEMADEPKAHYYLINSGESPTKLFSLNTVDGAADLMPNLYAAKDPRPFTLFYFGMEDWIYDDFGGRND